VVEDTWAGRDLLFLRELVDQLQLTPSTDITAQGVGTALSWDDRATLAAFQNLRRGGYLHEVAGAPRRGGDTAVDRPLDVTEKALRAVGAWPTPETALDRIIAALEAIAENTDDEDTRTRARRILAGFAGAGRQIGIAVAGAAITGQLPGAS
jgi:hypothetical protein